MPGNFRIILEMTGKLHEERIAFKFHFQYNIFSKSKNHISKSYSNMILDKKTGKVGI